MLFTGWRARLNHHLRGSHRAQRRRGNPRAQFRPELVLLEARCLLSVEFPPGISGTGPSPYDTVARIEDVFSNAVHDAGPQYEKRITITNNAPAGSNQVIYGFLEGQISRQAVDSSSTGGKDYRGTGAF